MDESTSTTETTTTKSSGQVKISVEEYNELMRKAAEPKHISNPVYTTIEKTPEMQATDMIHYGAFCMGGGGALFLVGAFSFWAGKRKLAAL